MKGSLRRSGFWAKVGDCPNLRIEDLWETPITVLSLLVDLQISGSFPLFVKGFQKLKRDRTKGFLMEFAFIYGNSLCGMAALIDHACILRSSPLQDRKHRHECLKGQTK